MSVEQRRAVVDRQHSSLSMIRQCKLLGISRSGLYYRRVGVSEEDLALMKLVDGQYLATPFYGARKMAAWLRCRGYQVNRKRIRRLMRMMGLRAIYRRPRTSTPAQGHRVYPYLLREVEITRPNQAWAADITYIPMERGFMYLVPTSRDGLVQPVCALLEAVQHTGCRLLHRRASGGPQER